MRGSILCIYEKYAGGIFAQGCLYLCVFLRQQKHRCATYIYAFIFICNLWELFLGLLCLHPIFKNASAETSLTTPSRDQIIHEKKMKRKNNTQ